MIKKLVVKDYKSLKYCEYNFEEKNKIFCGKNGSGKTHILEAFKNYFLNFTDELKNCVDQRKCLIYECTFVLNKSKSSNIPLKTFKGNCENILRIEISNQRISYKLNGTTISKSNYIMIHALVINEYEVLYNDTFSYTKLNDLTSIKELAQKNLQGINTSLEGVIKPPYSVNVDYNPKYTVFKDENFFLDDVFKCNTGSVRDAHLELIKKQFNNKKTIFIYDEFETHYHPQKVVKEYYDMVNQFDMTLISTHSSELLNVLMLDNAIELNHITDGRCRVTIERERLKGIIDVTKLNSKFLFSDFIIFVEGRFDTYFVSKLLENFNVPKYKYDIFEMNGAKNHLKIREFMKRNSLDNYIIILDKDVRYKPLTNSFTPNNDSLKNSIYQYIYTLNSGAIDIHKLNIDKMFEEFGFKKEEVKRDKNKFPLYSNTPIFEIGNKFRGKYVILDYDLELELCNNRSGRFAIKNVMNLSSVNDVSPEKNKEYKRRIIEIIDYYFSKVKEKEDIPPRYKRLIDIFVQ